MSTRELSPEPHSALMLVILADLAVIFWIARLAPMEQAKRRIAGRREMNLRTAALHPDRESRERAAAFATAYACALGDFEC